MESSQVSSMREFLCDVCDSVIKSGTPVEIKHIGTVVQQGNDYAYMTERKILICSDCP